MPAIIECRSKFGGGAGGLLILSGGSELISDSLNVEEVLVIQLHILIYSKFEAKSEQIFQRLNIENSDQKVKDGSDSRNLSKFSFSVRPKTL